MYHKTFRFIVFVILVSAGLSGCNNDKRSHKYIILYDPDFVDKTGVSQISDEIRNENFDIDTVNINNLRLKDSLFYYNGVCLLANPNHIDVGWQSDIERYIESGGSLIAPAIEVNKYQWPWFYKAYLHKDSVNNESDLVFLAENEIAHHLKWEDISKHLSTDKIRRDRVNSPPAPDPNRFTRVVLDADVNEPMELGLLPDGKILFIERNGLLKRYDPEKRETKVLHNFNVSTEGNYEDGLLGLTIDPNYEHNYWIYIFYSPQGGEPKQNVSRFLVYQDSLYAHTEKIILEIPVQRETCCHSAGSLEFGPDGNLYISTGDNTSSKASDGYSPLDERPGRGPFDAQKSSANTHDLRGKILRIKPTATGTYTIPEGNLFPKDGSEGRPEIYAMGCRNPFRFSIDSETGFLYWGDVGPDSGKDSTLGPRSYDEWNQARKPGNFGWPYFEADNKAYPMLNFATGELGPPKDPAAPTNFSPNNYGSKNLPPAQGAMIWYPYNRSEIWPMFGEGSRTSMAGPVYHRSEEQSKKGFPSYYNGKLFIYEWSRSWIKVVSFDEKYNLKKIEPFLPDEKFVKPIDMEFDSQGSLYILEYGANYFANNVEARLVKIEYNEGNRLPVPNIKTNKSRGAAPLTVEFSGEGSYDNDASDTLSYVWIYNGIRKKGKNVSFTLSEEGTAEVYLVLKDSKGDSSLTSAAIMVGNAPPQINLEYSGNQSFYFGEETNKYKITVNDQEDGSTENGTILPEQVGVNFSYLQNGHDLALLNESFFNEPMQSIEGKLLIDKSDCWSCHARNDKSVGPSYMDVSQRYKNDANALSLLANKVISGGNGNWGEKLMAAHPQLTKSQATEMVKYILSLSDEIKSYPLEGTWHLDKHKKDDINGEYIIGIKYMDRGHNSIAPISVNKIIQIKYPVLEAENYDFFNDVQQQRPRGGDMAYVSNINSGSCIGFEDIDLTSIGSVKLTLKSLKGGVVSFHIGSKEGPEIGRLTTGSDNNDSWRNMEMPLKAYKGIENVYLLFENQKDEYGLFDLDKIEFVKGKQ